MAEFSDDPSIDDAAVLWRRIPPWHFVFDGNQQRWRSSSAAFVDDADGHPMSVLIADQVLGSERSAVSVLAGHPGFALASITAGEARSCGQGVVRDPLPHEPAHALIFGPKPKSTQRRLAKGSAWIVPPEQSQSR